MQETHCPLCLSPLEVRDVAPCHDCGNLSEEIEHFRSGKHTYAEYEVFPGLRLVLCDFCAVDFDSYDPACFGFSGKAAIGFEHMRCLRRLDSPTIAKDKVCVTCQRRLPFLRFVCDARALHSKPAGEEDA